MTNHASSIIQMYLLLIETMADDSEDKSVSTGQAESSLEEKSRLFQIVHTGSDKGYMTMTLCTDRGYVTMTPPKKTSGRPFTVLAISSSSRSHEDVQRFRY